MGSVLILLVDSWFLFAYQWPIWVYVFKYMHGHKGETLRLEIGPLEDWSKFLVKSLVIDRATFEYSQ